MSICAICRFGVPLDDVAVRGPAGRCVCLGCYGRETGNQVLMPKRLRGAIAAVLDAIPA